MIGVRAKRLSLGSRPAYLGSETRFSEFRDTSFDWTVFPQARGKRSGG